MSTTCGRFASRAGEKLDAALEAFGLDLRGADCADFGCNVGGFTDCLLRRGAAKVFAVDTGYGELAWRLRNDRRVVVMERTNALYAGPPEPVDLVAVDVGWTPQELIVPAAARWLAGSVLPEGSPAGSSWARANLSCRQRPSIVSLLKPHYELAKIQGRRPRSKLSRAQADDVCLEVCRRLAAIGCPPRAVMRSVLRGKGGNVEFFLLLESPRPQITR